MKRLALISLLVAVLLPFGLRAQDAVPLDSAVVAALDSRLDEYFAALEREPIQVKIGECDFMLESCADNKGTADCLSDGITYCVPTGITSGRYPLNYKK